MLVPFQDNNPEPLWCRLVTFNYLECIIPGCNRKIGGSNPSMQRVGLALNIESLDNLNATGK